jgi:hypothetical protein
MLRLALGMLCCFALFAGCGRDAVPPPKNGAKATSDQLSGRLDAAMAMTNSNQRDEALQVLVADAATAGEGEMVKEVLAKFTSTNLKDDAAVEAALALAEVGQAQAATDIAKTMSNLNQRDEVLAKIAKGQR